MSSAPFLSFFSCSSLESVFLAEPWLLIWTGYDSTGWGGGVIFDLPAYFIFGLTIEIGMRRSTAAGASQSAFCRNGGCVGSLARTSAVHVRGLRQTLDGSFSAVSKPNFASKCAFESSRRDLHKALLALL